MKIIAILIDDDTWSLKDTRSRLKGVRNLVFVAVFTSVAEALVYFEAHPEGVDVIFCDIMMPDVDGFEANRLLDGLSRLFVFLSQKTKFADEPYELVTPVGFLRKPVNPTAARALLAQLDERMPNDSAQRERDDSMFFTENTSKIKKRVNPKDIMYIKGHGKFIELVFENGEKLTVDMALKTVVQKLRPTGLFIRISNDCVVSYAAIDTVSPKLDITLVNTGTEAGKDKKPEPKVMAVARTYQKAFREFMKAHNP